MPRAASARRGREVDAREGADGSPEPQQLRVAGGRREGPEDLGPDLGAQRAHLAPRRGIVAEEAAGEAERAQREAREGDGTPPAHARDLQATAAEIGHGAVADRQRLECGERAEAGFLTTGQHTHLDAFPPSERLEQLVAVGGSRTAAVATRPRGVWSRFRRPRGIGGPPGASRHRIRRKVSARAAPQACLDPFLLDDAESNAFIDAGKKEASRVRAQVDQCDQLGHGRSVHEARRTVKWQNCYEATRGLDSGSIV